MHCGISGTVRALSPMPVIGGEEVLCVTVENDSFHTPEAPLSWNNTPEGIVCLMADAGLVGMGGAGFPTAVKFSTDKPIHQVLINGCECEPYLTCDHRLMLQEAEKVIKGAQAMGRVVEAAVTICVENNKPDAVTALEQAARDADVKVLSLPARYPQGGERQLIQAVTGLEVPDGKLPADVGVLVSNVATAAALADAMDGTPLTHRIVTVSGQVNRPANLRVPIGTLLPFAGTLRRDSGRRREQPSAVYSGRPHDRHPAGAAGCARYQNHRRPAGHPSAGEHGTELHSLRGLRAGLPIPPDAFRH